MSQEVATIPPETKVAIWDLDGTLLNSFGIFQALIAEITPRFSIDTPREEEMLANYHGSLGDTIASLFGDKLSEEDRTKFEQDFLAGQDGHYLEVEGHLFEDALDLSRRLSIAGIRQVVVTNRGHAGRGNASPRSIVERSTLVDHIEHIICGDEVAVKKPDRSVLGTLLDDWDVSAEELVVIGDQHVDAELAANLGCKAIIVSRGGEGIVTERIAGAGAVAVQYVSSLGQAVIAEP